MLLNLETLPVEAPSGTMVPGMLRRVFLGSLPAAGFAIQARAQAPIRVSVNEVIVPVTVTDDKGRFVSNLDAKDFHIFDEGKEQKLDYFSRERSQPVVVGFLLDMSNAMKIHWAKYQDAATELILNLLPGDPKFSGYLITFGNEKPELQVDTTTDSEKMVEKLRKLKPAGGAAFFDSIYMACANRKLVKGEPFEPRRVLIVIGDGHDTASKKSVNEVLELAQRNLITIYAMSTEAFGFSSEGDENLGVWRKRRAAASNTRSIIFTRMSRAICRSLPTKATTPIRWVPAVMRRRSRAAFSGRSQNIAGEVTTQYILRYVPDVEDTKDRVFRKLKVTVDLQNVKIRYRIGYYPRQA